VLRDAHFMSIADRSILACWGVAGGRAGKSFQITVDPGGPDEHDVDALADAEPLTAGTVVRIRTTGGGGWGDPLDRPVDEVLRDIAWRKVSVAGAREDYGVVVLDSGEADRPATEELRATMRAARTGEEPFFDRGPGYATLSGGAAFNEFDVLQRG
jgi:N-methylhydantoinase B